MEYEEAVTRIERKRRFGKAKGCEVTRELMERLGHPEDGMKTVHIAGTNGKGSTAAFVSSILQAAGFVVGLFTSPHLIRFTERIKVNGEEIPKEDAARLAERLLDIPMEAECTMFDLCLAMAVLYFKEKGCDYVVMETGLGGGGDSTTGLGTVPIVSAITNIGLDHTQILGDTIEKIAEEKAGILKKGTTLVLGVMDERAKKVITGRAEELGVPCKNVDNLLTKISTYEMPLNGGFQRYNAALAAGVVEVIFNQESGYLSAPEGAAAREAAVREGIRRTRWPGRMELVGENPWFMVDGAHNPQGVEALFNSLSEAWPNEAFIFLTAVMSDKDHLGMMKQMLPLAERFLTVRLSGGRAADAGRLAEEIASLGVPARACADVGAAVREAKKLAGNEKKIVAFGSLYFIGEIKAYLQEEREH